MISSYLKLAWRSLVKNRLASFINVFGLALGLAVAILVFLIIKDILSFNRFHENFGSIHLIMKTDRKAEVTTGSSVPGQLAVAAKAEMPEISHAARCSFEQPQLKVRDKSIYQTLLFTDPEFFQFMTFPSTEGNAQMGLQEPNSIVLTESAAKRLFGTEDPLGKTVTYNNTDELKVTAVIQDVPFHSMYKFDVVMPFSFFEKRNDWLKKWDDNRILTFVQVKPNTDLSLLNKKLTALVREKSNDNLVELFAYPLKDVWLNNSFRNGYPNGGRVQGLVVMSIVGLFVLLIACVNFMNLATARSEQRFREVGVRKTLGASRMQLIMQFMGEAFLLTFFAMVLGVILSKLFLPFFNQLLSAQISYELNDKPTVWALVSIGVFTALVAGSYPAFYLSRPQAVSILKGGKVAGKRGSIFRRVLVTFQFAITIVLIISTITILRQEHYMRQRPIGYEQQNLIDIPARGDLSTKFELVKHELTKIPGVESVSAGNDDLVHFGGGTDGIEWPGKTADQNFFIKVTNVQYDWVKTAGLHLVDGREFSPDRGSDSSACLITETAVRKMGLKEPVVGTRLGENTIIGVVKDFMFNDVFNNPEPMVIYLNHGPNNHFFLRIRNNEQWRHTMDLVRTAVKKVSPDFPFEYRFTAEEYQRQFNGIETTVKVLNYVGVLTILISCLGLFGLSVFLAERRAKEISIRKILGAGIQAIWFSLSRDFLKPVLIAFIIAAPLSGWVISFMLSHFDYRISMGWDIFAIGGCIAFGIAVLTVSFQGLRSALASPVNALRSE